MSECSGGGSSLRSAEAAATSSLYDLVERSQARAIAVIGLVKNAGKTTVVNALMDNVPLRFGLTSLGLDGERTDHLTGLAKPRIAPPEGTLVATTTGSLDRSHYSMEIVAELPFRTALGRVVIGVARGDGAVEVSGPTTLRQVRATADRLLQLGATQVLVDGAINRLGSASPRVTEGLIMATGGMVADTLDEVVEVTAATFDTLTLPTVGADTLALLAGHHLPAKRLLAFNGDGEPHELRLPSVIGHGVTVAREVQRLGTRTLYVGGALTHEFVDDLLRVLPPTHELKLVVRDATVLILPAVTVARLRRRLELEVLSPLSVLAVTANPFRVPHPYSPRQFFGAIVDAIGDRAPIFDVVNGLQHLPGGSPLVEERAAAPVAHTTIPSYGDEPSSRQGG
jgi:hypothetical protein